MGFPCPQTEKMKELLRKELGENFPILEYTH